MKILVAMQYWEGDREDAQEVCLQMADLLDRPSEIVSLAMVHRHDSKAFSTKSTQKLAEKFKKVFVKQCTRRGEGFPFGCNEMSYFTLNWPKHDKELFQDVEAIFIMEADCVVTRRNWDMELYEAWTKVKNQGKGILANVISGAQDFPFHVNAVGVFSKEIVDMVGGSILAGGPATIGWDWWHGKNLMPHAVDSHLIYLDYRRPTITKEELFSPKKEGKSPLIYHGVKDGSARQIVRDTMKPHVSMARANAVEEFSNQHNFLCTKNADGTYLLAPL